MEKQVLGILFTDLHLDDVNKEVSLKFANFLKENIKKYQPRFVAFLGDFFDKREGLIEPVLNTAVSFWEMIRKDNPNLPIFAIPGNHDKFVKTDIPSYLQVYKQYLMLFSTVNSAYYNNYEIFFFPYFEGKIFDEQIKELVNKMSEYEKKGYKNILCAHYMYEQLPAEITSHCEKIFLGHNHEKEEFPKGEYIGSCFQRNFDENNEKGLTLLYTDYSTKQIVFKDKEYFNIHFNLSVKTEQELKDFVLKFKETHPNDYLRIVLEGFYKDISLVQEWLKEQNVNYITKLDNTLKTIQTAQFNNEIKQKDFLKEFDTFCELEDISEKPKKYLRKLITKNENA